MRSMWKNQRGESGRAVGHSRVTHSRKERLSPQQISVELRREFPDNPEIWMSYQTIYESIYVQGRGALRRELAVHLRTGRGLRKPRRKASAARMNSRHGQHQPTAGLRSS